MKRIIISAVNFTHGGPLSVLLDCLEAFHQYCGQQIEITVLVHKKELVTKYVESFNVIEYPDIKSSWFKRIYFEYFQSRKLSRELDADLWIALHDMTPNVFCPQIVYCHNPSPFYKLQFKDLLYDKTFFLFCLFYRFLYRINIRKNLFVIVQQEWLRKEFEKRYKVKTLVAYPFKEENADKRTLGTNAIAPKKMIFFYPAFARVFKNFEVLLEAATLLSKVSTDFEVWITIDGSENNYAKQLQSSYCHNKSIKFLGLKTREQVFELYEQIDCLVFPSKLETWGLPISEFKNFNKPMLLADLQYAYETLGEFEIVKYFDVDNAKQLCILMQSMLEGSLVYDKNTQVEASYPYCKNWPDLINYILTNSKVK